MKEMDDLRALAGGYPFAGGYDLSGDAGRDPSDDKTAGEATPEPVGPGHPPEESFGIDDAERDPSDDKSAGEAIPEPVGPPENPPEAGSNEPTEEYPAEVFGDQPPDDAAQLAAEDARLMAVLEAIVYVADEPLTLSQIANALSQPQDRVEKLLEHIVEEYAKPEHGLTVREVAGGYKIATKPEHHEAVRQFVKNLNPPLKLSMAALETLAVIAYKQPLTAPEIMEIRGVQGAGVLKTLLDRKLITTAGRKNVVGKPILYKTTKDFLVQFGLKDLSELPSLKEFEELRRLAFSDTEEPPLGAGEAEPEAAPAEKPAEPAETEAAAEASAPEAAADTEASEPPKADES